MPKGGKRPGAGRKPGAASRKTREIADRAAENGQTPLEYMLSVMRDNAADPELRARMAVAAAPFVHARICPAPIEIETTGEVVLRMVIPGVDSDS